jgi:hypothetical protein
MTNRGEAIVELELVISGCRLPILHHSARRRFSMKTPRLDSQLLVKVVGAVILLAVSCFAPPEVRAQSSPSGSAVPSPKGFGGYRSSSLESLYTAAKPPELTYTNSVYGFSFRFPSNFILHLGNYSRGIFSSHSDSGAITLATVMIPPAFWTGTNAGPMFLFVGVNPMVSMGSCEALVAPDEWTAGAAPNLTIGGVEFKGRNEVEKGTGRGSQSGVEKTYQRQYAEYSHGVCYEFEIDTSTADQSRLRMPGELVQVDLDRVFSELEAIILTTKIEVPNPGARALGAKAEHVTKPWETSLPFPKELAGLDELSNWDIQYPPGTPTAPLGALLFPSQYKICGIGDWGRYMPIAFGFSSSLDNVAANAEVDKLAADVIRLIRKEGWKSSPLTGGLQSGTPDCYAKDSVFVDFAKGTSRCTMNSPCTVHDELMVTVYIPAPTAGAAQ